MQQLAYHVLALCEQNNIENTVFCEQSFGKKHALLSVYRF